MAQRAMRLAARRDHDVRAMFVTRALAVEDQIIRDQSQGRFGLSEEQKEAVRYLTGDERIRAFVGLAGAGKSTLLAAARRAWEADRYRVHGAALAGKAAAELERSADRARGRGGWSSGAAFLERAATLTPDEDHQARRMLAAAENRLAAGEAPAARALLGLAAPRLRNPGDPGFTFTSVDQGGGGGGSVHVVCDSSCT